MSKRPKNPRDNGENSNSKDNTKANVENTITVGEKNMDALEMSEKKEEVVTCNKNEIRQRRCSHTQ